MRTVIYLRMAHGVAELVDESRESGAHAPLVIARGRIVVAEDVPQGGRVDVALRFVGESTIGR